jgi:hypothetical protein
MTTNQDARRAAERLIQALAGNDAGVVPLSRDVEYGGPLQPEPVRGEAEVREHLAAIAPFLSRVELKRALYDGDSAALVLDVESVNGVDIEGTLFLRFGNGGIRDIRVYFDTAPLLRGGSRPGK